MDQLGQLMMLYDTYGEHLTARQRQAFTLRYGEDLSLSELAIELATSRPAAAYLLRRARESLRRLEEEIGALARERAQRRLLESLSQMLHAEPADLAGALGMIQAWLEEGGGQDAGVAD